MRVECQNLLLICNNISTSLSWPVGKCWHLKVPNYSLFMMSNLLFLVMQVWYVMEESLFISTLLWYNYTIHQKKNSRGKQMSRHSILALLKMCWNMTWCLVYCLFLSASFYSVWTLVGTLASQCINIPLVWMKRKLFMSLCQISGNMFLL